MERTTRRFVAVVLTSGWLLGMPQFLAAGTQTGVDAIARHAFTERVERYAMLRARLEEPLPALDVRRNPLSVLLMRGYLASEIRAHRSRACLGDIFTAEVGASFRNAIAKIVEADGVEGLMLDDTARGDYLVDLAVNEPVPKWALRPVPTPVLLELPPLPEAIEYWLVADALVLWDVHAEILIDALPSAF